MGTAPAPENQSARGQSLKDRCDAGGETWFGKGKECGASYYLFPYQDAFVQDSLFELQSHSYHQPPLPLSIPQFASSLYTLHYGTNF